MKFVQSLILLFMNTKFHVNGKATSASRWVEISRTFLESVLRLPRGGRTPGAWETTEAHGWRSGPAVSVRRKT